MAALKAAELVQNDMIIGLGTGSTVKYLIDQLGKRVKEDKLRLLLQRPQNKLRYRPNPWA
ncbi:hypothetical protein Q757_02420 [Oenococcus alcoholitolerans]|uniref:Ribose-5-phosphate isomerase n=1 Tax=Oenococcus alcoholitolerans TaxID=931074 RepID=A0ABR4XRT3_9LACO|nr:hypothetical protein Q757_02420 [Oenococcus alcoholitolerans]